MAKLISALELSGTIGGLSFYRLTGSDRVIVRRKGGPSKTQVRNSPKMAVTRLRNTEFSGRAIAAGKIMQAMAPLKSIADYNLAGALNKLLFAVRKMILFLRQYSCSQQVSWITGVFCGLSS